MRRFVSYAKFNLYLAVLGERPDGYHEIDTVLQSISLGDELVFRPLDEPRLEVECEDAGIPSGPGNLVWRALCLLREQCGVPGGMWARLRKRIPARSGLGGGSSNAACTLAAANLIWDLGLGEQELERLGARLGSDVPFFIRGGTQRCMGRGERLEAQAPLPDSDWLIVKPRWELSTADVYARVRSPLTLRRAQVSMILRSIAKRELPPVVEEGFNDLEGPAGECQAQAARLKAWLSEAGLAGVRLAGSGSAWVGYCPDPETAWRVKSEGRNRGWVVLKVKPTGRGWIEGESSIADFTGM